MGSNGDSTKIRNTQYAKVGNALIPTTGTVQRLPAGIYKLAFINYRWHFDPFQVGTDNLVMIPDSKSKQIADELDQFWKMREKFTEFGLTFKRGVLLYGPPGTGKTCTISLVSQRVVEDDGIVILVDVNISALSSMLRNLREVEPERKILVVMEDLEEFVESDESGLTSLLDGEASIDGVCYLATTNHIDEIPDKIAKRPSRFDLVIEIGPPNAEARRRYLESRKVPKEVAKEMVTVSKGMSFAHLKELVVAHLIFGKDLKKEVKRIKDMVPDTKKTEIRDDD